MDVGRFMSVETGSVETGSLELEEHHNGLTSQETGVMEHDKRLITEAGTDHSGKVQDTGARCLKTELKNNVVTCRCENIDRQSGGAENFDRQSGGAENFDRSETIDDVSRAKETLSLAVSKSVDDVSRAKETLSLAVSKSVDDVSRAKETLSLAVSKSVDDVSRAKETLSLAVSKSVDDVSRAKETLSLAVSKSVDDVSRAKETLSLAVSKSVDDVSHQTWLSEEVSKSQNKLFIRGVVDHAGKVENIETTGRNCDILGNDSIEMDGSKTENSLLAPLSTDVNICAEVNVLKNTCNGDVYLEEESVKQEIGQQYDFTSESPLLVHCTANEDANISSGNSLNISEIPCSVTDIHVDTAATCNSGDDFIGTEALKQERNQKESGDPPCQDNICHGEPESTCNSGDDLIGTEALKQERNQKESGDPPCQDNICHGGPEPTCNNVSLSDEETFKQDYAGTDGGGDINESSPSVPSADKDSAMDSTCLQSTAYGCDCDVKKDTSEQAGDLQAALQNSVQIDGSPSLDPSTAHKCAQNISCNDVQVNVEINGGTSLDPSATQEIDKITSLDPTPSQEETNSFGRYESDVSELSLDNSVCEAGKQTSKQEIFPENVVKTITCVHRSSSFFHIDKGENWQSGESNTATFDNSISFVENDTLKQEISMKTATYVSRSSSLVPLDKTRDENSIPEANFEDSLSIVESEALEPADGQQNVNLDRCLSSSPVSLNSNKITAVLQCDEKGLSTDKCSDENFPVDGKSCKIQELLNQGIQEINSDLQSTISMKHENSVSLDKEDDNFDKEDDNFRKQDGMKTDNQKILTDLVQEESCFTGIDLDISESPMTVNKTVLSESLDSDRSEIQMTSNKTVHCGSLVNIPESLITLDKTVQSAAIGVNEPEPLETVTKTVHSDSSDEGELEILTEVDMTVQSYSSEEIELEVLAEGNMTVHSDSTAKGELEVLAEGNTTVHSDNTAKGELEVLAEGNMTVHSDNTAKGELEVLAEGNMTVHSDNTAKGELEVLAEGNMTVHSDNTAKGELEVLAEGNMTVHSDSTAKGELEVLAEGNTTVHSDNTAKGELEVLAEGNTTVHSDNTAKGELEVLAEGNMTVHSDSTAKGELEVLAEGNTTVHSDSTAKGELEVLAEGNMTVHSDNTAKGELEVLAEGNTTVHSDSTAKGELEVLAEGNMTVHSDSTAKGELEVLAEGNTTVHSDSTAKGELEVLAEGNTTVHSDNTAKGELEVLAEGNTTVHSDNTAKGELEVLAEGNTTVHSDNTAKGELEVLAEGNMTVHSDSTAKGELEVLAEGNMTVHSDSSEEIELEVMAEGNATVHSDSMSVRSRKTVQSAAIEVGETESLETVRKTVHSDSSGEDDTGQFSKTVPLRSTKKNTHESVKTVAVAAYSENAEDRHSESQEMFNEAEHFEDAGGDICESLMKSNNKAMSKKKKRMKEKKGHRKKSKRKQKSEQVAESLRLVEVSGDKYGAEGLRMEEMESDGVMCNQLCNERMLVVTEEELLDQEVSNQQMGGLLEPGELEFLKERKKKAKKKKKRRRRVATVEEDDVGDDTSQKFPTYLDGFFLHYSDRNEELGEIVDDVSVSFDIQPGMLDKDDRIHHRHFSYESADSVKSDNCRVRNRDEEMEGRRRQRHDKREHKERKRKQKDRNHSYEALYEREHPSVTLSSSREYTFENERYRSERHEERVRSSERKIRRIDREHIRGTVLPDPERRGVPIEEVRRHAARNSPQDSRTVIAVRSPIHSNQHKRRSQSRGMTAEAEQERRLERAKHTDQHNTGRMSHKRDRHAERNHRSERNSDKENNRSHKRRRQMRTQENNDSHYRGRNRNARRVRRRGASTSSSSSSGSDVRRRYDSDGGHCVVISLGSSDDDGASSDVILVESEKIVINLDDEEDPPSGVRFTRRRNGPAIARKTNEPAIARKTNEPAIARNTNKPAIARKTNEPAASRNISEPVIARNTNEPAIARKANEPAIGRKTSEPAITRKANEPAITRKANEPAIARKTKDPAVSRNISEPAIARKTKDPTVSRNINEPAIARKTKEPTIARVADEPAIAKKGVEPAIAMKSTKSAIAVEANEPTIATKVTEPAIAKKGTEPVIARKTNKPDIAKKSKSKNRRPPLAQSASLSAHICNSPRRLEDVRGVSERQECSAAPASAKQAIEVESLPSIVVSAVYDPMYPTEEEECNFRHVVLHSRTLSTSPVGQRPPSPDYPAPEEGRPYTPPLPVVKKIDLSTSSLLYPFQPSPDAANSHLTSSPANPTLRSPQQQASVPLPRHFGTDFEQVTMCPDAKISPDKQFPNGGLTPGRSSAQQSPLSAQDTAAVLSSENSRLSVPSNTVPFLPPPPPPPFGVCLESAQYLSVPAMGQVSQPSSPQPVMDRHNMASCRDESLEMCSNQHTMVSSPQPALTEKSPLVGSLAADLSSSCSHSSQGHDGGDMDARNTLDFSSEDDDDYHLELLSPKANNKKDLKQRKQRRQHSGLNHDASSGNSGNPGSSREGSVKPGKDANKLVPKETLQVTSDRSQVHRGKKKIAENNVREEDDDVPASAADLTCKEKFMKKLYFQERVIEEVKMAVKPFYISKKITKEQYKVILRKAVPKVCHNRKGNINPQKILQLVKAYVSRMIKGTAGGAGKKQHRAGERLNPKDKKNITASVKHSGDRTISLVR